MSLTPRSIDDAAIQAVVLQAMHAVNMARDSAARLIVSPDAPIFGHGSPLDSLGLVALLMDIEEGLQELGCDLNLSDERAVSQTRSPFRSVAAIVAYIAALARE